MLKFNRIAFSVLLGIIFLLLLYKSVKLPVVTDEVITSYYLNFSIWDIMMYKDHYPNNHILNTLLTKLFIWVFGDHQLVLRLPNILFFLVYGMGVFRLNRMILKEDSVWFIPAALLFTANPYLLDFFGMCRGYGISCALAILSVSYLVAAFRNYKLKDAWIALILSILASYANFTLLVFWVTITLFVIFFLWLMSNGRPWHMVKQTSFVVVISLFYMALIATPVFRMQQFNEFQYWSSNGFYNETIYPLILYSRGGSAFIPGPHIIASLVLLILGINLANLGYKFRKHNNKKEVFSRPVFITTGILLVTAFVNISQCWLLKTPNLHGRTALFFYPLTIAAIVSFIGVIPLDKIPKLKVLPAFLLAFVCLFHLGDQFKINWVRDAWYSVDTLSILDILKEEKSPVTLKTQGSLYHSIYYYTSRGEAPWVRLEKYQGDIDVNTDADFYFIFPDQQKLLEEKFKVVKVFKSSMVLMRKRE